MGSNVYKTPDEMAKWLAETSGEDVDPGTVKRIALEGGLLNEKGELGLYELLAYMAMFVK